MKKFKTACLRVLQGISYNIVTRMIIILLCAALFSGCSIFSKKNRCNDCPKWSKAVEDKQYAVGTIKRVHTTKRVF